MNGKWWKPLGAFAALPLLALLSVACQPQPTQPTPEVIQQTVVVDETVVVRVEVQIVVTTTPAPEEAIPEGRTGRVRFLIAENFWADWDPYQHTAQSQARIESQIFDYLIDFPDGDLSNPQPMLATEWSQIDDRIWEFTLCDGVRFHDGSTFDAEDAKASIELASGATDKPSLQAGRRIPTTVEIIDPLTVRLRSEQPFAGLFAVLRDTIIVSADDLANNPEGIRTQPNGTGPFKLVLNEQTRKVMEANLDYWQGPPKIAELIWEFV